LKSIHINPPVKPPANIGMNQGRSIWSPSSHSATTECRLSRKTPTGPRRAAAVKMSHPTAGVVVFNFCFAVSNVFLPSNISNNTTTGARKEMYNGIKYAKAIPSSPPFRMIALNPISEVIEHNHIIKLPLLPSLSHFVKM
jgi:hypothetical protein